MVADDTSLEAALQRLPAEVLDALLVSAVPRHVDAGLGAALAGPEGVEALAQRLATLRQTLPDLLEPWDAPPGWRIATAQAARLRPLMRSLTPERWTTLHRQAAAYCAARAADAPEDERAGWQTAELFHWWAAEAAERHERLDALFRECLRAHDGVGCQALLDAVADGGGEGDPLLSLWRGVLATEVTRDWGAAEAHFQAALERPDLAPSLRARIYMEAGLLNRYSGRYDVARQQLAESCRLAEEAGDALTLANALMNQGIVCSEGWAQRQLPRSALDEALACELRGRDILLGRGDNDLALRAWNNMGIVYKQMGRLDDAEAAYRAALALALPSQRWVLAGLTNNIAEVQELQGHWAEAQRAYEEVVEVWRAIDDYELADALLNLGAVQERRGLIDTAIASYREAITAVESVRARLKAEEARAGFLGTRLEPYERLVRLSLAQPGGTAAAFETVERAKARAFIELLAERPIRPPAAVPATLLERERVLRRALAHLYRMVAGADDGTPPAMRARSLESELEEVYRRMRRLDAQYAGSRTVDPLALVEVQRRLPRGAALLEYFATGEEIGCIVVTAGSAEACMLPGVAALLQRRLTDGTAPVALPPAATAAEDEELYATLLAPVEPLLAGHDELYVVPHGLLHYLPLHALGTSSPLLEHHRVAYAPSASILLGDHARHEAGDPETRPGCLALGYGATLRYAELEARHVAALTGGAACTGGAATAEALYRLGPHHRTLHLACHGTFNPQAPLASGLLLADGKLDAMTILQGPRLHADLVVLSACDTGRAAVLRGDELMGLARAFLYAGAAAVLVSLWPCDDLATALLMDAFYRARAGLPSGAAGAAEALRRAQLSLRSLSLDEALAAGERLQASAAGSESAWADLSLAGPQAASGEDAGARRLLAQTGGAQHDVEGTVLAERPVRAGQPVSGPAPIDGKPYAHPYYWAAFTLVCGGIRETRGRPSR